MTPMSAVELDEINDRMLVNYCRYLDGRMVAGRDKQAPLSCGDCAAAAEDGGLLCATHRMACENCGTRDGLHDGDLSRAKVDRFGAPCIEQWCGPCDPPVAYTPIPDTLPCPPPVETDLGRYDEPTEAEPWGLAAEEEAPALTAEAYVERLRMRDGAGHARSYGDAADEQEDHAGQLPWTVTTAFGQGRAGR